MSGEKNTSGGKGRGVGAVISRSWHLTLDWWQCVAVGIHSLFRGPVHESGVKQKQEISDKYGPMMFLFGWFWSVWPGSTNVHQYPGISTIIVLSSSKVWASVCWIDGDRVCK